MIDENNNTAEENKVSEENTTENNSTENSDNSTSNQNKKKSGLWEALTQPLENHFSELF